MPLRAAMVVLAVALAGCREPPPEHPYPADVVERFVASCTARAPEATCRCAIDRLQRRFPLPEFTAFEAQIARGEVPRDMANVAAGCRP